MTVLLFLIALVTGGFLGLVFGATFVFVFLCLWQGWKDRGKWGTGI